MLKTYSYQLLEEYFRKYGYWPTTQGLRGFGPTILIIANLAWGIYPFLLEIKDYQVNFGTLLVHTEFLIIGVLLISANVQTLRHRDRLFKMIYSLSDYNKFGKPKLNNFIDNNLRNLLKLVRYGGYLTAHVILAAYIALDDNCIAFKNTKYCLVYPYYVPFAMNPLAMTLTMLFELYTIKVTFNILFSNVLIYCYSLELLIGRTVHLTQIIADINLTRNKKNNINALRNIALYQQHIFELFQITYDFFTRLLVTTKISTAACLSVCCTDFFLRKTAISFLVLILSLMTLLLIHTVGQKFTTANNKIAEAVYNLNWYEADVSTRKFILFLLLISQRELKLDLPLFGEVSNSAAANDFKKIYVFFNWMSKVTTTRNFSM